ncbi:hypothetical protein ACFY3B_07530 [Micromonospora parva]|uniref:Uncharacterized protein n=1 Tax=Micromonospora parva TaxID=1464048 RepID=A0ABW6VR92_9ACTN
MIVIPFVVMYWAVKAYIKWPAARVAALIFFCFNTAVAGVGAATQDAELWPAAAFSAVISALMAWHVRHTFTRRRGNAEDVATGGFQIPRHWNTESPAEPTAPTQTSTALQQRQRPPEAELEYRRAAMAFRMLLAQRALAGITRPTSETGARPRTPTGQDVALFLKSR